MGIAAFEFDAQAIGHILEFKRREIRLPGPRAQAGELRDDHPDGVIALRSGIGEGLQGSVG